MVDRKLPGCFGFPAVNICKFYRAWWNCEATIRKNFDYFNEEDRRRVRDLVVEFNKALERLYEFRYWVIHYCLRDEDPAPFTPPEPPVPPEQKIQIFFNRSSY